jgi:hypothetical protein
MAEVSYHRLLPLHRRGMRSTIGRERSRRFSVKEENNLLVYRAWEQLVVVPTFCFQRALVCQSGYRWHPKIRHLHFISARRWQETLWWRCECVGVWSSEKMTSSINYFENCLLNVCPFVRVLIRMLKIPDRFLIKWYQAICFLFKWLILMAAYGPK